jgi:hypothetical protein
VRYLDVVFLIVLLLICNGWVLLLTPRNWKELGAVSRSFWITIILARACARSDFADSVLRLLPTALPLANWQVWQCPLCAENDRQPFRD